MSEYAIRAEGLSRDYGKKRALDKADLALEPGRVVALLGPNGAGKSTLLKLWMGLLEPTEGAGYVLGHPARALPPEVCPRITGMLDGAEPPDWATAGQIMNLQADASPHFDRAFAEEFVYGRGVKPRERYGTLSKGRKRWLVAGVCLASRADVLLLDEPADGLDTAARRLLYDAIRDYVNERDATVIVATHIIHDIERIADDVVLLRDGKVAINEPLEDLREHVREVEVRAVNGGPDFGEATVLGVRSEGDTMVYWVVAGNNAADLTARLGPNAQMRPVDLETLYLAATEHAAPSPEPAAQGTT
ncbi:MAG: ABC transporter ATP-binding protein [bacterium]|nr:ABC transporter ATP-binding protein [bacterium]